MLGKTSCRAHAQINGAASNNTEAMDVLLYDGTRLSLGWMTEDEWERKLRSGGREGEIYAKLKSLRQRYQPLIEKKYPRIPDRISGYNLEHLIPHGKTKDNLKKPLDNT